MKPTKLIVSYDSYSWIKYCSGIVIRNPNYFSILIVSRDDVDPIFDCNRLCREAIYEQRTKDLYNISTEIGVREVVNLGYTKNSDLSRLVAQIQLKILIGGITEIYYQSNKILYDIFRAMKKTFDIEMYSYNVGGSKKIELTLDEYRKKNSLMRYIIGNRNKEEISDFPKIERFEKLI